MKHWNLKRVLSLLLVVCMVTGLLSGVSAMAETPDSRPVTMHTTSSSERTRFRFQCFILLSCAPFMRDSQGRP